MELGAGWEAGRLEHEPSPILDPSVFKARILAKRHPRQAVPSSFDWSGVELDVPSSVFIALTVCGVCPFSMDLLKPFLPISICLEFCSFILS